VLYVIVACEIGFWVVLLAGLAVRYRLGLRRAGAVVLACVPLVDLVLLVATVIHLRTGATAQFADGLAAVYLGVSVAYGHQMMSWADARFAHRFAGVSPPVRPPRTGPAHARRERRGWYRHVLAFTIGCALILGGVALVGDASQAHGLLSWIPRWALVLVIDFVWSFSYTFRPRPARNGRPPGSTTADGTRSVGLHSIGKATSHLSSVGAAPAKSVK
jgi:hypothetical protein